MPGKLGSRQYIVLALYVLILLLRFGSSGNLKAAWAAMQPAPTESGKQSPGSPATVLIPGQQYGGAGPNAPGSGSGSGEVKSGSQPAAINNASRHA